MSHVKRYWLWTAAFAVAWIWLFWFTDLHISVTQSVLILLALNFFGASQRHFERHKQARQATAAAVLTKACETQKSCPTRLLDGRNEIRCWSTAGHEGPCK